MADTPEKWTEKQKAAYRKEVRELRDVSRTGAPERFRLNHSEIIALLATKNSGGGESVTITRNAKGVYQFEATARTLDHETIEDAAIRAIATVVDLAGRFPYTNGDSDA